MLNSTADRVQAIETRYKGYRFRSRTEARWAVFFDAVGYDWTYEDQGYAFADGTSYLPDFRVQTEAGTFFAEVKGDMLGLSLLETKKILLLAAATEQRVLLLDGPPDTRMYADANTLLQVLEGEFDWAWHVANSWADPEVVYHPNVERVRRGKERLRAGHADWLMQQDVALINDWLRNKYDRCAFAVHSHKDSIWHDEHSNFWSRASTYCTAATLDAIGFARSARFEHGERPFCAPAW